MARQALAKVQSKECGFAKDTKADEITPPIPIPRLRSANCAPKYLSRCESVVSSVAIALWAGHIADWPMAHIDITKNARGAVCTVDCSAYPMPDTTNDARRTGFGPQ